MKPLILSILGVGLFIVITGYITGRIKNNTPGIKYEQAEIKVGQVSLVVEIADNDEKRQLGLSNRESINTYNGMLFIFSNKDTRPSFWMKDMKIAIDIIWIDNGIITQIDARVPPPKADTPENNLKLYRPSNQIDFVLEVEAGFCENNLIKIGDPVDLTKIPQVP